MKVKEKLSSVSSAFDLNTWLAAVTVCGISSSLRQVTVVPAFTVRRDGTEVNFVRGQQRLAIIDKPLQA